MGHLEGVTFIDSRGDGRHLISNGKDQSIKLWDIRKMSSNATWYVLFILPMAQLISLFYSSKCNLDIMNHECLKFSLSSRVGKKY